jgi:hypothetical protein
MAFHEIQFGPRELDRQLSRRKTNKTGRRSA